MAGSTSQSALLRDDKVDKVLHMMRAEMNPRTELADDEIIVQRPLKVGYTFGGLGRSGINQWTVDHKRRGRIRPRFQDWIGLHRNGFW